ncbi:MAG: hypothetical protein K2Y01_02660 [Rhabdochlamydiaceae bacterium]|nr:hypothetical protein [Rhabdochlamydiaceae bacterium]
MTYLTLPSKTLIPNREEIVHFSRIGLNTSRHLLRGSVIVCQLAGRIAASTLAGCQMMGAALTIGYGTLSLEQSKGIPRTVEARKKAHRTYKEIIAKERHISLPSTNIEAPKKSYLETLVCRIAKAVSSLFFIECITLYITGNLYQEFKNDKDILEKSERAKIAKKRTYLALLNEMDSIHMLRISALQISTGLITLLTKGPIAHLLHYSGVIAQSTGMMIGSILGGALGITFILRGTANIYYGNQNRELIFELRQKAQKIYETKNVSAKQKALQIKQLLDLYCTIQKDDKVDFLQTKAGALDTIKDDAMLYKYMQTLDQALHKKIVEFEIIETLGTAMLIGGIFTLAAIALSGGSAILITTLLTSVALLYVEETRSIYRTSKWFNAYQKDLYKHPEWLLAPRGLEKPDLSPKTKSTLWYLSRIPTAIPRLLHYSHKQIDRNRISKKQAPITS